MTASVAPLVGDSTQVILVSDSDEEIGVEEKMRAHEDGLLHRAISVFIFDSAGRMLVQRRAENKYHSGGQWSNACCSHPVPGETAEKAAHRRLREEIGISCGLTRIGALRYRASMNGLTEYEFDHVFLGLHDGVVCSNPAEVAAWQWVTPLTLSEAVENFPDRYTPWFHVLFRYVVDAWSLLSGQPMNLPPHPGTPKAPGMLEATILPADFE